MSPNAYQGARPCGNLGKDRSGVRMCRTLWPHCRKVAGCKRSNTRRVLCFTGFHDFPENMPTTAGCTGAAGDAAARMLWRIPAAVASA